ncbi:hypothetical protein CA13_48600 [Planctomycetes bacterium CA13]|uniref:Alpha/beta-hydrolase family protein n=1 Tax=Novipirellula herctigrandis TaxID=2527986 RepID=A0A5C5Z822_9BACT|nr:hypothetical protein CA13_48600 [Planctomycetes bacterium CA13]
MKAWLTRYTQSFSFIGLIVAALFFSASVTPSLLPRHYVTQGVLSAFALAIGYSIGIASVWFWQFLGLSQPSDSLNRWSQRVTVVFTAMVFIVFLRQSTLWQNSIRELMEMPPVESAYPLRFFLIAVGLAAGIVAFTRVMILAGSKLADKLDRFLPPRISRAVSTAVIGVLLIFVANGVLARGLLNAADSFFSKADELIDEGIEQPTRTIACGSSDSLVLWESIGRRGKDFIAAAPTQEAIAKQTGADAMAPIRVYVGMRTEQTMEARAALALAELKRVGGFDRSVLIVATPTGTGWLDPGAVDTLEYLHHGDTAMVTTQYSYLPSWITILVDPSRAKRSAKALFDCIYDHWKTLPKDNRPRLYLHGLSLGCFGGETAADVLTIFEDPGQGCVWSGPPFPSAQWAALVQSRNPDSPQWLPTFRDQAIIRFTAQKNALDNGKRWSSIRNVYIQHASDPMVWFSPDLAWHRPDWLNNPRGPDVSPELRWYPIVTFLQIAFDLPMATTVPIGYGHNYSSSSYIDAWIAVTEPNGWDKPESIQQLKAHFADRE